MKWVRGWSHFVAGPSRKMDLEEFSPKEGKERANCALVGLEQRDNAACPVKNPKVVGGVVLV